MLGRPGSGSKSLSLRFSDLDSVIELFTEDGFRCESGHVREAAPPITFCRKRNRAPRPESMTGYRIVRDQSAGMLDRLQSLAVDHHCSSLPQKKQRDRNCCTASKSPSESTLWVKRVGRAVLACRLHPRLRTYGCDAGTDASGHEETWVIVSQRPGVSSVPPRAPDAVAASPSLA
jgi:hypothetical protein